MRPENQKEISIHALRVEGDVVVVSDDQPLAISIHALREEGDLTVRTMRETILYISIHALREEGDQHIRIQLA